MDLGLLVLQIKQKLYSMGILNLSAKANLCGGFIQRHASVSGNDLAVGYRLPGLTHLLLHRYVIVHWCSCWILLGCWLLGLKVWRQA